MKPNTGNKNYLTELAPFFGFSSGGLAQSKDTVDPVSGNPVPVGSTASEVRDDIPARVSEGEYVVPADVVRYFGVKFFEDLRSQAKDSYSGMASDGRIGGEEPMMSAEDDDPEDAYELAAKISAEEDDVTEMFLGGLFGKKKTNTSSGSGLTEEEKSSVTTAKAFNPTDYAVVGGSIFGHTQGVEYVQYTDGTTTVDIPFFNGRPLRPIPLGFYEAGTQQTDSDPNGNPERTGANPSNPRIDSIRDKNRAAGDSLPDVNLYDMSEQELLDYAKGGGGFFDKLLGRTKIGDLAVLSRTRAALLVAADRGMDLGALSSLEQQAQSDLGVAGDLLDELVASGNARYNSQQVYNPSSQNYVDPQTGRKGAVTTPEAQRSGISGNTSNTTTDQTKEAIPLGNDNPDKFPAQYDEAGNKIMESTAPDPARWTGRDGKGEAVFGPNFKVDTKTAIEEAALATFGDDLDFIRLRAGNDNNGKGHSWNHAAAAADVYVHFKDGTVLDINHPKAKDFMVQAASRGIQQFGWGNAYMGDEYAGIGTPDWSLDSTGNTGIHMGVVNTDAKGNPLKGSVKPGFDVRTWADSDAQYGGDYQSALTQEWDAELDAAYKAWLKDGENNSFIQPIAVDRSVPVAIEDIHGNVLQAETDKLNAEAAVEKAAQTGNTTEIQRAVNALNEVNAKYGFGQDTTPDLPLGMGGEKRINNMEGMPGYTNEVISSSNSSDSFLQTSMAEVRQEEGFAEKAYWDVNAWRAGYGSDTITNPDGSVERVTQDTVVDKAAAERDLLRRTENEFLPSVRRAVGEATYNTLSPEQAGVLAGISYNYGTGVWSKDYGREIVSAVQSGDDAVTAALISGLGSHNGGIRQQRYSRAAETWASNPGGPQYVETGGQQNTPTGATQQTGFGGDFWSTDYRSAGPIAITEDDRLNLARFIEDEAGQSSAEDKLAVGATIANQWVVNGANRSVSEVLSNIRDLDVLAGVTPSAESQLEADRIISGMYNDPTNGSTSYYTEGGEIPAWGETSPSWDQRATINGKVFGNTRFGVRPPHTKVDWDRTGVANYATINGERMFPETANTATTTVSTSNAPRTTGAISGFEPPQGGVPVITVGVTGPVINSTVAQNLITQAAQNPSDLFARADSQYQIGHIGGVKGGGTAFLEERRQQDHPAYQRYDGDYSEGLRLVSPVPVVNSRGEEITTEVGVNRYAFNDYVRDENGNIITNMTPDRALNIAETSGLGIMGEEEYKVFRESANYFDMAPQNWKTGTAANTTTNVNAALNRFGVTNPLIVIKEQLGLKPVAATAKPLYADTGVGSVLGGSSDWMTFEPGPKTGVESGLGSDGTKESGTETGLSRSVRDSSSSSASSSSSSPYSDNEDRGAERVSSTSSSSGTSGVPTSEVTTTSDATGGSYNPVTVTDVQTTDNYGGYSSTSGKDYYGGNDPEKDDDPYKSGSGAGYQMAKGGLISRRKSKRK